MTKKYVDHIWLAISIFSFAFMAVGFLLMPIETEKEVFGISLFSFTAGVVFWSSLIIGTISQIVLAHRRKKWCEKNKVKAKRTVNSIGITSFFKNKFAVVADVCSLISLIGFIISLFLTDFSGNICYLFLAFFVFSFSMHCILNGKTYYYVINQTKMLEAIKREREKSSDTERAEKNEKN